MGHIVIADNDSKSQTLDNNRSNPSSTSELMKFEQAPISIIIALMNCIKRFLVYSQSDQRVLQLEKLSLCGQMHGVILWSKGCHIVEMADGAYELSGAVSNLITWQDQRCSTEFLQSLPMSSGLLATGYGCASLFWLLKHSPNYLSQFDYAGTIADFIVAMLCDLPKVVMSDHNAASWGYYDSHQQSWQIEVLRNAGFPTSLLPVVVPTATKIGHTSNSAFGLPLGIPVYVAAGDAQCSAISTQFRRHQAVLNLGTSCQLSFLSPPGCCGDNPHLQAWPFQKENHLLVAASMNGGNVLAAFVDMLRCWLSDLDIEITDDKIWSKIAAMSEPVDTGSGNPLLIKPTMLKERTTPRKQEGATVLNILPTNVSLASTYQALCVGLIQNINEMLPVNQLQDNSISEIICTGSLFSKHPFMLTAVQQVYQNITVRIIEEEVNAALGSILMTEM